MFHNKWLHFAGYDISCLNYFFYYFYFEWRLLIRDTKIEHQALIRPEMESEDVVEI
jgi:hypothetical protein